MSANGGTVAAAGGGGGVTTIQNLLVSLGKVSDAGGKKELLANLKTAMGNLSRAELTDQMGNVNLEVLFECLGAEDKEMIESTCEILRCLMDRLDPVESLQKYHESILQGFFHPVPDVPALVVAHLTRCIETSETSLNGHQNLIIAIIHQLVANELSAAKEAAVFLMKYSKTDAGKEFLLGEQGVGAFQAELNDKSVVEWKKLRVYESLVDISTVSEEHFVKLNDCLHMMGRLVDLAFDGNDPLGQMNALEILSNLVGSPHGHSALQSAGVFEKINRIGQDWRNTAYGSLIIPGVIKFIGKIGAVQLPPEELTALVLNIILESGKEFPLITVGVEAVAYIGTTVEGKRSLKSRKEVRRIFEVIREVIHDAPTEFRVRALDAMAILFGSDEAKEDCLPHWFNILFRDISQLFELVRLPFPEIRLSGLNFLAAIAHLDWAQRHYLRGPGVMEFLLNRDVEPEKECVHAKYKLVRIIVDSPSAAEILSPENMARLKVYVKQGPFYSEAQATVATKGTG